MYPTIGLNQSSPSIPCKISQHLSQRKCGSQFIAYLNHFPGNHTMKTISFLATLLLPFAARAWVVSLPHYHIVKCNLSLSASRKGTCESPVSSRRQWLTTTAAAAVCGTLLGRPSVALAVVSGSATTTAVVSTIHTCDTSVSVWRSPDTGRKVYLVGTAHISATSAELAGDVIDDVRPDAVFVELDAKRIKMTLVDRPVEQSTQERQNLTPLARTTSNSPPARQDEESRIAPPTNPTDVIQGPQTRAPSSLGRSNPAVALGSAAVGSAIKGMYSKLGNAGFSPGEEFAVAVREGQNVGAKVILGDRDVDVTLRRLSEALRQTDLRALLSPDSELEASMKALMPNDLPMDSKDDNFKTEMTAYVETMKAKENVNVIMGQLKRVAPEIYQALVAERDAYMANGLDKLNMFPVIVAVMGIAHIDGVEDYLKSRGWIPVKLNCKPGLK
jgi:uncharacterized protein YbaP (TraB family)